MPPRSSRFDLPSEAKQRPTYVISQLRLPKPPLIAHIQGPFLSEAEIGHTAGDDDLTDKHSAWIPYVDAIAAAAIDVAVRVAFDAVGAARVYECEEAAIGEERSWIGAGKLKLGLEW
jgi:hypothetical protein